MAKSLTLHTRVEPEIKEKADAILSELGVTVSDAINMFLHQIVYHRGIPLDLRLKDETIDEKLLRQIASSNTPRVKLEPDENDNLTVDKELHPHIHDWLVNG